MRIRNKLILSYVLVIVIALLIVAVFFDYSVANHFERIFDAELRRPEMDRILKLSNPFIMAVRQSLVLAALGSGVFAILVGFFLSRYLVSPMQKLIEATEKIAQGKYDVHVRVDSDDEVAQLANALNQMALKLEEIEILRRELVANISHELATPLTNIRGYLEALNDGLIKGKKRNETMDILREETERLTEMVEDVRDLAVYDDKRMKLRLNEVNVKDLIENVLKKFDGHLKDRRLEVELENLELKLDQKKFEQMLINLLNNAVKYADEGGMIQVILKEGVLIVADDGIGIPKRDLPYIFERFFRSDRSRSRDSGGNGIGLAIVKQIVDAHAWEIEVESKVDKGTSFRISF